MENHLLLVDAFNYILYIFFIIFLLKNNSGGKRLPFTLSLGNIRLFMTDACQVFSSLLNKFNKNLIFSYGIFIVYNINLS